MLSKKTALQSSDIIIQFGSIKLNNIYDSMAALGNKAAFVFVRDSEKITTEVLLEK